MRLAPASAFALALVALGGCRARDNDPGPGGVTVGEARALDDAAKMLESRPQAPATDPSDGTPGETASAAPAPKPTRVNR